MRPKSARAAMLLALAVAVSCTPEGGEIEAARNWGSHNGLHFCEAIGWSRSLVHIRLSRVPRDSGISLESDTIEKQFGQGFSGATLAVNGRPVRANASGMNSTGGRGVMFEFNPRGLLHRNPNGFTLSVNRDGQPVLSVALEGARKPFRDLIECDLKNVMGTGGTAELIE